MTELLAPAGSTEALRAAFAAGADAVYIGGSRFGARAYADNPDDTDLLEAIALTHRLGKKLYLTVNTLIKDEELDTLISWFRPFYNAGVDAVIVQDLGVIRVFRAMFPDLPLHASTQMTITGTEGAMLLKKHGIKRIVPARELSLKELAEIREKTGVELETFVHGAMCYSFSGACLMSSMIGGRSGNRGRCAGICRLPFRVENGGNASRKQEVMYPMNMKDLCAIDELPDLIRAGISSFKIEGRMKKPEYTAGVTAVYRRALDACLSGHKYTVPPEDRRQLLALYNRDGFTKGYYFQHNGPDMVAMLNEKLQGKRQQEAQKTIEKIRGQLHSKQTETLLQRQVHGHLYLRADKPAVLTIEAPGPSGKVISVSAEASGTERAASRPVTEERIRQQLNKTGTSAFAFSSISIDMESNLFVPMQTLNTLRRNGFAALEKQLQAAYQRTAVSAIMPPISIGRHLPDSNKKPEIRVLPHNEEQLEAVIDSGDVDGVYLPVSLIHLSEKARESGKKLYLALPYILRQEMAGLLQQAESAIRSGIWDGILLRNLEETGWYARCRKELPSIMPPAVLDATIYTMNMQAVSFFADMKLTKRTLPLELNFHELRNQDTKGSELILYGRTPLMFSAQCLKQTAGCCDGKPGWITLTDRKQASFPVYADCRFCGNTLYNSLPVGLIQEAQAVKHLECSSFRLEFTNEPPNDVIRILHAYAAAYSEGSQTDFNDDLPPTTKGHFRRGVE